jgi:hypothetical protein
VRSTLTEIYLWHTCSCHEILRVETHAQVPAAAACASAAHAAHAAHAQGVLRQQQGLVRARRQEEVVSLKRPLDESWWLQFTSECQRV